MLFQTLIYYNFSSSCDFHEPLNLEFNWIQSFLFKIQSGHPSPKKHLLIVPSLLLSFLFWVMLKKIGLKEKDVAYTF